VAAITAVLIKLSSNAGNNFLDHISFLNPNHVSPCCFNHSITVTATVMTVTAMTVAEIAQMKGACWNPTKPADGVH
jgi:hypothetical protein